jgi:hypothetical protein
MLLILCLVYLGCPGQHTQLWQPSFHVQVKALKAQRRAGLTAASLVGDFADEVADLVDAADGSGGRGLADLFAKQKVR